MNARALSHPRGIERLRWPGIRCPRRRRRGWGCIGERRTDLAGHDRGRGLRRPVPPAGVHVAGGTSRTEWWRASVRGMPTEYDSHLPRFASQMTNAWVPPAESVRSSVWRPRRYLFGSRARASGAASVGPAARCRRFRGCGAHRRLRRLPYAKPAVKGCRIPGRTRHRCSPSVEEGDESVHPDSQHHEEHRQASGSRQKPGEPAFPAARFVRSGEH